MKKDTPMVKVEVTVNRIAYATRTLTFMVPAVKSCRYPSQSKILQEKWNENVKSIALDKAGGECFSEHDVDYEIEMIKTIN